MFSEQRSSQNCWQEIVGTVGRGRLVTIPARPISHQPVGVGQPGGPGRDALGEAGREQNLSPQCSLSPTPGTGGSAKESLAVQDLYSGTAAKAREEA